MQVRVNGAWYENPNLTWTGAAVWGATALVLVGMAGCSRLASGIRRLAEGAAYLGMFA